MKTLLRRSRAIFVAIAALAISAGAVFAARAMPTASQSGLARATEVSGKLLPARPAEEVPTVETPPVDEPETEEPETEAPEAEEPATDEPETANENHGAKVSDAATGETPDGYRNHGEYVSEVARENAGQERAAENRGEKVKPAKSSKAGKRG